MQIPPTHVRHGSPPISGQSPAFMHEPASAGRQVCCRSGVMQTQTRGAHVRSALQKLATQRFPASRQSPSTRHARGSVLVVVEDVAALVVTGWEPTRFVVLVVAP